MTEHWKDYLVRGFTPGKQTEVTITVDPGSDNAGMVQLASRITGLYDALKGSPDSLLGENTDNLLYLADHLNRVIGTLTGMEDAVLRHLQHRAVPSRTVAAALDTNHRYVLRRWSRIAEAAKRDLGTRGLDQADLPAST